MEFRRYAGGQAFGFMGGWLYYSGLMWIAFKITDSPLLLGLIGSFITLPYILSPFTGALADIFERRVITLITLLVSFAQTVTLAVLAFTGTITYPMLLTFAFIHGAMGTIQEPSRLALLVDMVGSEHVSSANGVGSIVFNFARVMGPILAGFLLRENAGWCFATGALLYLPIIYVMSTMKVKNKVTRGEGTIIKQIVEGAAYLKTQRAALFIMLVIGAGSVFGYGVTTLLPAIASKLLGLDSAGYGILQSMIGLGAMIGGFWLSSPKSIKHDISVFVTATIILPIIGLGMGFTLHMVPVFVAAIMYFIFGFVMVYQNVLATALLPRITDPKYTGRMMGFLILAFSSATPIGNIIIGALSQAITIPIALISTYVCFFVPSLLCALDLRKYKPPEKAGNKF